MSIIKSFSVNNGDMFYICHDSDNFTLIDCNLIDERRKEIINEIKSISSCKVIKRFISTHPDEDHIHGLDILYTKCEILNFYCVENNVNKKDRTNAFIKYRKLRDSDKACYLYSGLKRYWINSGDDERKGSGISILWPNINNNFFKEALNKANNGESPNNISPIISYTNGNENIALWMGDLETDYMNSIKNDVPFQKTHIVFAPHHGRDSGKIPEKILRILDPDIIVIGEAPSDKINYYSKYNTITQNRAGDIVFEYDNNHGRINVYTSNNNYEVNYLHDSDINKKEYGKYIGSIVI